MSCYEDQQQQHQDILIQEQIQLPKLLSSLSYNRNRLLKQSNQYSSQQNLIYLDKSPKPPEPEIQIYQFTDHTPATLNENEVVLILGNDQIEQINSNLYTSLTETNNTITSSVTSKKYRAASNLNKPQLTSSSPVVPAITNVDEIFQLLSHKIAKYCQILSDLTNCEVFYKAQLPLNNEAQTANTKSASKRNLNKKKSLYWGTHQMLFQYSHNQGIKYDKNGGDSLIKINQRSISNDVTNLIEEILNAPSLQSSDTENNTKSANSEQLHKKQLSNFRSYEDIINEMEVNQSQTCDGDDNDDDDDDDDNACVITSSDFISSNQMKIQNIDIKDCCVYLNRLDDELVENYLHKFESKYNNNDGDCLIGEDIIGEEKNDEVVNVVYRENKNCLSLNELPSEEELYSDEFRVNLSRLGDASGARVGRLINGDDDEFEDDSIDDERTLLEKNLCETDLNENDEDFYTCEKCDPNNNNHSFRHLPQLKVNLIEILFFFLLLNKA